MSAGVRPLEVAAAVIEQDGKILISKRSSKAHQGGKWEFPGGKLEAGESALQALSRELHEELGILVTESRPLIRIPHHYPDKSVVLSVFKVSGFTGSAHGKEGQPVRWVDRDQLGDYDFPAANNPILQATLLPEVCAVPAADWVGSESFLKALAKNVSRHRLILLKLPGLQNAEYTEVATQALEIAARAGCKLLLTSSTEEVESLNAGGLHLNSGRLMSLRRRPADENVLVSADCHSEKQLQQAEKLGLDFVFLSPVNSTPAHPDDPDDPQLGWSRFSQLVENFTLPVYASGGIGGEGLSRSFEHGAQGIARKWDL